MVYLGAGSTKYHRFALHDYDTEWTDCIVLSNKRMDRLFLLLTVFFPKSMRNLSIHLLFRLYYTLALTHIA